jgi:glutathione peroxidase
MSIYDYHIKTSSGEDLALDAFKGQVILAVNTATQCGLTPQFSGLEKLHQDYKEKGLQVIGFPCNQFAGQEPLSNEEMAETCQLESRCHLPTHRKD